MAKRNFKYNNTVDLTNLPRQGNGYIKWKESIGRHIPFTFNDNALCGEFKIIDYRIPDGLVNPHVYLEYQGIPLKPIPTDSLKKAKINQVLDPFYVEWKYEIGEILKDDRRDITIIDRFRRKDPTNGYLNKYYKIRCNICGFDSGEHYRVGEYREEYIVLEGDLCKEGKRRCNCPCCSSRIIVPGINDIPTTDSWMVPYFQNGYEEAKKYSHGSKEKIQFICPNCNRVSKKMRSISEVNRCGLSCVCSDNLSYPNKFAFFLFEELESQYDQYVNEYSPEWAKNYRYDNYFEIGKYKYIVEMDGALGHGKRKYKSNELDYEGLERDKAKDELAREHNIEMIRINCDIVNSNYIWSNILESRLSSIFDFSNIDVKQLDIQSKTRNIYKEICEFQISHNDMPISDISKILGFSKHKIYDAIKVGREAGWTNYKFSYEKSNDIYNSLIEYWNKNFGKVTSSDAAKYLDVDQGTVSTMLKRASKEGLVNYDPKEQLRIYHELRARPIYVYDINGIYLCKYKSIKDCELNSLKDFDIQFTYAGINQVANNRYTNHKGYIFSYKKFN